MPFVRGKIFLAREVVLWGEGSCINGRAGVASAVSWDNCCYFRDHSMTNLD